MSQAVFDGCRVLLVREAGGVSPAAANPGDGGSGSYGTSHTTNRYLLTPTMHNLHSNSLPENESTTKKASQSISSSPPIHPPLQQFPPLDDDSRQPLLSPRPYFFPAPSFTLSTGSSTTFHPSDKPTKARYCEGDGSSKDPLLPSTKPSSYSSHSCPQKSRSSKHSSKKLSITYAYASIHGAVDQLLPASYKALETSLHFSPTSLGSASACQKFASALICPLWGVVVDTSPRKKILIGTCGGWGVTTILLACTNAEWQLLPLLAINGMMLASVGPLTQTVLGREVEESKRGKSFGNMHFCQSLGRMVSLMITTVLSNQIVFKMQGWRLAFILAGCVSIGVASWFYLTLKEERPRTSRRKRGAKNLDTLTSLTELKYVLSAGSFWSMLLMGIIMGIPKSSLNFITMWFQYCGLLDVQASIIVSASWFAAITVAPFVGHLGDLFFRASPNHGRPLMAQVSLVLRSLFMWFVLSFVPKQSSGFWVFLLLSVLIGLLSGWTNVGANRPILTEIVKSQHWGTVFALTSTCERIGAAFLGAPMVGILSEKTFGYRPTSSAISKMDQQVRIANANALASGLMCLTVGPWLLSLFFYGFLHLTYGADREAVRQEPPSHSSSPPGTSTSAPSSPPSVASEAYSVTSTGLPSPNEEAITSGEEKEPVLTAEQKQTNLTIQDSSSSLPSSYLSIPVSSLSSPSERRPVISESASGGRNTRTTTTAKDEFTTNSPAFGKKHCLSSAPPINDATSASANTQRLLSTTATTPETSPEIGRSSNDLVIVERRIASRTYSKKTSNVHNQNLQNSTATTNTHNIIITNTNRNDPSTAHQHRHHHANSRIKTGHENHRLFRRFSSSISASNKTTKAKKSEGPEEDVSL